MVTDPQQSWVAKWQRLQDYTPGTYAIKVVGVVSTKGRSLGMLCGS